MRNNLFVAIAMGMASTKALIMPTHSFTTSSTPFLQKKTISDVRRQRVTLHMSAANGGVVITGGAAGIAN
jgi:hypothetical protein